MSVDTKIAIAWSLLLPAFVLAPLVYAATSAPPGTTFTGSVEFYFYDSNTYLAWIRQASEGWWLFVNRYTTEPTARCFFHPVFLALGLTVRATGLPPLTVWVAARLLSAVAAVFCLFLFLRRAVGPGRHALVALALVTLGAGVGWTRELAEGLFQSADVWMPELTFYQSIRWPILWSVALILMLGYFAAATDALTTASSRKVLLAGAIFTAVAFVHPYNVVTFAVVPGAFLAAEALRNRRVDRGAVGRYVAIGLIAAPAVLYQLAVVRIDPVLRIHSQHPMLSPSPVWYAAGFGPCLLALAALGLGRAWRRGALARMAVVWAAAGLLLLYAPVPFNRRLVTGLIIPIGLVASYPVEALIARLADGRPARARVAAAAAVVGLLAAVLVPTNLLATRDDWRNARGGRFPFYISDDMAEAFAWLRAAPRGVVLAEAGTGNLVPAFTGQTVYAGHFAQTVNLRGKTEEVKALLTGRLGEPELRRLLIVSRARYLLFGPRERGVAGDAFDPAALGPVRFQNDTVQIIELAASGS